jgi:hypothetical protein
MWNEVGQALRLAMTRMLDQLVSLLPGIMALIAALVVSALIAWVIAAILRRSLTGLDFDGRVGQWGFPALSEWSPSSSPTLLVTRVIGWIIVFIGFLVGLSAFDGELPSRLVIRVFAYLPDVLAAIGAVNLNLQYARLLSVGVKWMVTVLAVTIAMEHLHIGVGIVRLAFGILFGGIVLALALAVGLGSKELVSRSLEREANKPSSPNEKEPVGHL